MTRRRELLVGGRLPTRHGRSRGVSTRRTANGVDRAGGGGTWVRGVLSGVELPVVDVLEEGVEDYNEDKQQGAGQVIVHLGTKRSFDTYM